MQLSYSTSGQRRTAARNKLFITTPKVLSAGGKRFLPVGFFVGFVPCIMKKEDADTLAAIRRYLWQR